MAWSDAARRAAAEARRRKAKGPGGGYSRFDMKAFEKKARKGPVSIKGLVKKAGNYYGSVGSQSSAIQRLSRAGYDPKTGKRVGKKRARRIAADIGDWANE